MRSDCLEVVSKVTKGSVWSLLRNTTLALPATLMVFAFTVNTSDPTPGVLSKWTIELDPPLPKISNVSMGLISILSS